VQVAHDDAQHNVGEEVGAAAQLRLDDGTQLVRQRRVRLDACRWRRGAWRLPGMQQSLKVRACA
jgi:hypothetical protein